MIESRGSPALVLCVRLCVRVRHMTIMVEADATGIN